MKLFYTVLFLSLLSKPGYATQPMTFDGQLIQGGLVAAKVTPRSSVWLDKNKVHVLPDGRFMLGFGRDFPKTALLRIQLPDNTHYEQEINVAKRNYKIQRIDGLPKKKVSVPSDPKLQARIHREGQEIKQARAYLTKEALFDSGFIMPAKGRITGVYGSQRILNGEPRRPHYGIDIAAKKGTPVVAPADGIIRLAQTDNYFSGHTIILDHGYRLNSAFLHLHTMDVKVGERVKQGQKIGTIGSTGRSTGPHLDWRMNWYDQRIDPQLLVK